MARKAETGVSKSALTDFTTGTSVDSRARRENCLKSGCSMILDPARGLSEVSQRASAIRGWFFIIGDDARRMESPQLTAVVQFTLSASIHGVIPNARDFTSGRRDLR